MPRYDFTKQPIDKPNLNGRYCLATEEHYDKLVEDGYEPSSDICDNKFLCEYYEISCNVIYDGDVVSSDEPMHLHNNEWVIGSLEHDEYAEGYHSKHLDHIAEPKPVERITREEFLKHTNGQLTKEMSKVEIVNKCLDYIEYLEAKAMK